MDISRTESAERQVLRSSLEAIEKQCGRPERQAAVMAGRAAEKLHKALDDDYSPSLSAKTQDASRQVLQSALELIEKTTW